MAIKKKYSNLTKIYFSTETLIVNVEPRSISHM